LLHKLAASLCMHNLILAVSLVRTIMRKGAPCSQGWPPHLSSYSHDWVARPRPAHQARQHASKELADTSNVWKPPSAAPLELQAGPPVNRTYCARILAAVASKHREHARISGLKVSLQAHDRECCLLRHTLRHSETEHIRNVSQQVR
jgi:hypothetical protein